MAVEIHSTISPTPADIRSPSSSVPTTTEPQPTPVITQQDAEKPSPAPTQ